MGVVSGVSATEWPEQGRYLGRSCQVCFNYDVSVRFTGVIVRDDMTGPGETIIAIERDGGTVYVRGAECMYSLLPEPIITH